MDKILLIDDEKDNLDALHRLLRKDYDVTSVSSALTALKLIREQDFSVLVSDQRMPDMTGVEFFEKARTLAPNATRILLTGYSDIEAVIESINRGHVYRYVAKPWDPNDLKITLNQAIDAHKLRKELHEKNISLEMSNRELRHAIEQLQSLDKAKQRFLRLMSHELKTPLTVLTSFVQLLDSEKKSLSSDLQKAVGSLNKASERFAEIIDEVLLLLQLETQTKLDRSNFDGDAMIESLIAANKERAKSKNVKLTVANKAIKTIIGDRKQISMALHKLVEDAINRSPSGTEVKITFDKTPEEFSCAVLRAGEPISESAFEIFDSGDDELHHSRGLGVALAIVAWITKAHHGTVAHKNIPNQGTWINLSLPLN